MPRSRFAILPRTLTLPILTAGVAAIGLFSSVSSDPFPAPLALKLHPRLAATLSLHPEDSVSVWIEFADKGVHDERARLERLAAAEAALTPKARARRLRARVRPVVDELDLPLNAPYLEALEAMGVRPHARSRWFNRVAARVPARSFPAIAALPCVRSLAPVERGRLSLPPQGDAGPTDGARPGRLMAVDYGRTRSQLAQIGVPALHDSGYTGTGVLVAVLDAGFNYFDKHEALREHVIPTTHQRDFVRGVYQAQDTLDRTQIHGTWVLGCMAGRKLGQYVGAAFDAEYALARTEMVTGETHQEMVYWGMGAEWADSLGADIISSSVGYYLFDTDPDYTYADMDGKTTVVSRAAQIAASKGILVVNSVGNEGANPWHYLIAPSDVNGDSVLAVGAVDATGIPAGFSSYGPSADGRIKPDFAARGVSNSLVGTSGNPQEYISANGTSFAAPLVAGLAACLMQARPQWTPVELIDALRSTASRSTSPDNRVGYGIPNGGAVLCLGNPSASPADRVRLRLTGPNPVNLRRGPAVFTLELPTGAPEAPGAGRVRIFDALGRRVRELWSGMLPCPLPILSWDGLDEKGRACGPGLYLVELSAGGQRATLRLTCLR